MQHDLKCDPQPFKDLSAGLKTFELRKDDRGYEVGDILCLQQTRYSAAQMAEGKPFEYTGAILMVGVSHLLRGPAHGLQEGYVVMSLRHA